MSDPIRDDYDRAPADESAQKILADAVARLEVLRNATVESKEVSSELVQVALAMFAPTMKLLRYDLRMFEKSTPEQWERVAKASEVAGDLGIARAILAVPLPSHSRPEGEKP